VFLLWPRAINLALLCSLQRGCSAQVSTQLAESCPVSASSWVWARGIVGSSVSLGGAEGDVPGQCSEN
jgi:hypothetical protein